LFSQNVQITKMDTFNLASVFTPGILLNPEHALNPAQYKTSQKVVQFLVEHQHCFKMPRSSWFTVLNQQQQDEEKEKHASSSTITTSPSPPQAGQPAHRHHSHPHYSTTTTTIASNTTFNNNNTANISNQHPTTPESFSSSTSSTSRPLSVIMSPHKEQRVKRAKTMPSRRSRYGPNDPLQIVQLNKSVIETTGHDK
jgi:hypothetical protein